MLTQEPEEYANYMDEENLVRLSWGELSVDYPDTIKTMHTSPEGHKEAYNIILTKLKERINDIYSSRYC